MRILVYTMLFPNAVEPHHGVFVKERLRQFRALYDVPIRVVAPTVATPPLRLSGRWETYRRIPREERVDGFDVVHPRYFNPPGRFDRWRARWMAAGVRRCLVEEVRRFRPTLLDVHYAYPDGVAAWRLRRDLATAAGRPLPLVVTARGTDLNLLPQQPAVRRQIARSLGDVDHVICVADALREVALELGVRPERVTTLRNGVDLERFTPGDQRAARVELDLPLDDRVVVCVGHLTHRKGQHRLVEAFASAFGTGGTRRTTLVLVGKGEERVRLAGLAERLGIADRVRLPGAVAPERLAAWYRAADVSVLASTREGWPNVVLESLACGTPILASRVWGTPEILEPGGEACRAGLLVEPTVEGLVSGLRRVDELDGSVARPWAERFGWGATVEGMARVFEAVGAREEARG